MTNFLSKPALFRLSFFCWSLNECKGLGDITLPCNYCGVVWLFVFTSTSTSISITRKMKERKWKAYLIKRPENAYTHNTRTDTIISLIMAQNTDTHVWISVPKKIATRMNNMAGMWFEVLSSMRSLVIFFYLFRASFVCVDLTWPDAWKSTNHPPINGCAFIQMIYMRAHLHES